MTELAVAPHTIRRWSPAAGAIVRGSVVLLPGRGEHAGLYERFGNRLAADGYEFVAIDTPGDADRDAVDRVLAELTDLAAPVVVAGADIGALRALLAATRTDVAGLLLAGTPSTSRTSGVAVDLGTSDWIEELAARTACPVHQARLSDDPAVARGSLAAPVPAGLAGAVDALPLAGLAIPTLVVHGTADIVAPLAGARALAARLPAAELAIVDGGRHDILNDAHHRTVAAHVIQWLERLRVRPDAAPILTVEAAVPPGGNR